MINPMVKYPLFHKEGTVHGKSKEKTDIRT
jgi:hypothetical protein